MLKITKIYSDLQFMEHFAHMILLKYEEFMQLSI